MKVTLVKFIEHVTLGFRPGGPVQINSWNSINYEPQEKAEIVPAGLKLSHLGSFVLVPWSNIRFISGQDTSPTDTPRSRAARADDEAGTEPRRKPVSRAAGRGRRS